MNYSLAKIWSQIKEQYVRMSKRAKIITLIVLVAIVAFSIIISIIINNKPYEVLFTGLNPQEATEIMGKLQEMSADYKFENNNTILVPQDQEPKLKAQLVSQGYPKSGLSYDIFKENINLMSTDFERTAYKLYDLQNRIESTIRMFDGVSSATVNISLPEESKYVLREDKKEATASVHVTMTNGGSPTADQVKAIITLVSTSVIGLKKENIGVTDSTGKVLTEKSNETMLGATQLKMALEREIDASVKEKLMDLIAPIYGDDNVRISVKSTVDVDKKMREIINFIPNENNKGIVSSESRDNEGIRDGGTVGGVPGTTSDSEVPVYPNITLDGNQVYFKNQEEINYIVSQVKEQVESDAGVMTDLSVSVAIGATRPDDLRYDEFKKMVAVTAGIGTDDMNEKVAVYYSSFLTQKGETEQGSGGKEPFLSPQIMWIIIGASALVTLLLILALIVLSRRRNKRNAMEFMLAEETEIEEGEVAEEKPQVEEEDFSDINLHEIKATREMELKKQIGEFAEENPDISAQLIRTWLKGEDGF